MWLLLDRRFDCCSEQTIRLSNHTELDCSVPCWHGYLVQPTPQRLLSIPEIMGGEGHDECSIGILLAHAVITAGLGDARDHDPLRAQERESGECRSPSNTPARMALPPGRQEKPPHRKTSSIQLVSAGPPFTPSPQSIHSMRIPRGAAGECDAARGSLQGQSDRSASCVDDGSLRSCESHTPRDTRIRPVTDYPVPRAPLLRRCASGIVRPLAYTAGSHETGVGGGRQPPGGKLPPREVL